MKLTKDHIYEILMVKNNCTFLDFKQHLNFLFNHFPFENTQDEEILEYLIQLEKDNYIMLLKIPPVEGAPPELCILLSRPYPKWNDIGYIPQGLF